MRVVHAALITEPSISEASTPKRQIMRLGERGDCAGEVSLADKHLPRTHTAVLEPGGIVAVISPEAWAAAVPRAVGASRSDVISEVVRLCDETGGNRASVEGRIRSQNVLHALKRRRSTLFKMLQVTRRALKPP